MLKTRDKERKIIKNQLNPLGLLDDDTLITGCSGCGQYIAIKPEKRICPNCGDKV